MRLICLGVLTLFSMMSFGSAPTNRYLLLLDSSAPLHRLLQPNQLLYSEENISVVELPESAIDTWSLAIHETLKGCGGFIDVTERINSGTSAHKIVWNELIRRQTPKTKRPKLRVEHNHNIQKLVDSASGQELWNFLGELTSFPDRSAKTNNGGKAARFLKQWSKELARGIDLATWFINTDTWVYSGQPSVLATLSGTRPDLPHVVIGAHFDTFGDDKPGADDDGSGSAVVMETLRAVAQSGAQFERTIDFIWYAAEERGLVGSSYVVDYFKDHHIQVESAMQFDMVGWDSSEDGSDIFLITDYTDESLTDTAEQLLRLYLPDAKIGRTACGYPCSDHVNWDLAGVPVAYPFESNFGNMNTRLHTENDKMKFLDPVHATRFARLALAFLGHEAKLERID